jgi:hypothetical protein
MRGPGSRSSHLENSLDLYRDVARQGGHADGHSRVASCFTEDLMNALEALLMTCD